MSIGGVAARWTDDERRRLLELRRALHADPELSWQEQRTAARLEAALRSLGVDDVRRVAGTGVVARVRGTAPGAPAVAIRGDIDALPIREATGLPFASTNDGVMHACGHDVHATWAVAAAALLVRQPAAGDVVVVLQPAEEVGNGALAILESGALDGVAAIYGGHVDRRFPIGTVVADDGPLAASADSFTIEIVGRGAHAARPHEGADPIVAAASLVGALQTIVARRVDPATPAVVTVGTLNAGTASNVIPDRAALTGTVRAVEPRSRALMHDEIRRIAAGIAAAHGVAAAVTIDLGPPPVVNDPRPMAHAREAARALLGRDRVVPLGFVNMAGEDFAHYQERIPGAFLRIGARHPDGPPTPAHQPTFFAEDDAIWIGAAILADAARLASASLAG